MYGGGTPLGGHTPGPCQASRLPPHNPRLHAPPKHGHVRPLYTHLLLLTAADGRRLMCYHFNITSSIIVDMILLFCS